MKLGNILLVVCFLKKSRISLFHTFHAFFHVFYELRHAFIKLFSVFCGPDSPSALSTCGPPEESLAKSINTLSKSGPLKLSAILLGNSKNLTFGKEFNSALTK